MSIIGLVLGIINNRNLKKHNVRVPRCYQLDPKGGEGMYMYLLILSTIHSNIQSRCIVAYYYHSKTI